MADNLEAGGVEEHQDVSHVFFNFLSFIKHMNGSYKSQWSQEKKKKRSDSDLWRKPLYQQKIRKPMDNTTRHQNVRLHNDCGPTVSWNNKSNPTVVVKPVYGYPTFPLTAKTV